jgi:diguanylate cyclase (GGDEF)-like protein
MTRSIVYSSAYLQAESEQVLDLPHRRVALPSEKMKVPARDNLFVYAGTSLSPDEIVRMAGSCVADPILVVDRNGDRIVAGSRAFFELLGISVGGSPAEPVPLGRFIEPLDRAVFKEVERGLSADGDVRLEIRMRKESGEVFPVHLHLSSMGWNGSSYLLGFVRVARLSTDEEARLRRQVEEQKARAMEAIKASLRVYQFNEKISRIPTLTRTLLHAETEEDLFCEAAKVFTSEDGLGYQDATFLLREDNKLTVAYSTRDLAEKTFSLVEDNRFSRFVRRGLKPDPAETGAILVELQSRTHILGFCEVIPHSQETRFFDKLNIVGEWQKGVLNDIGGIIALMVDNIRLHRDVKRQSVMDSLTNVHNRHYFVERLSSEVHRALRYSRPMSILFLDLDGFKPINDRCGHLQGDEVLKTLSRLFMDHLRDVDIVCRYGGDEFVVLLPETDEDMAVRTAGKLLEAVRSHSIPSLDNPHVSLRVTASIGVSTLLPHQTDQDLLRAADSAMYVAKSLGGDQVYVQLPHGGTIPISDSSRAPASQPMEQGR